MTKRGTGSLACTIVAVALIGIAAFSSAALTQQAQTASIPADDLFAGPNSPDFKGGVGKGVDRLVNIVKQAQTPGSQCPIDVDFTAMGGPHPDGTLMSQALAWARRDAIEAVLKGFGPSVRITSKTSSGLVSMVIISAQPAKDKERPKLDTNSVPRKGTKVKAGDTITVTMVARDNANAWQTGIKTIQLVADSAGGRFVDVRNYLPAPGCLAPPMERRLGATYTVPANPPPIVRLTALTEDFAALTDTDVGEFPTEGDWYGRMEWFSHNKDMNRPSNQTTFEFKFDGYADVTVTYDGQGNLTGTLIGSQKIDTYYHRNPSVGVCKGSTPPTPVRARVVGSDTPGRAALSLQLVDVEAQIATPCTGPLENGPGLSALVRALQPVGDGTYRAESKITNPLSTSRYSLTLRPAVAGPAK
ncbi:MAG: hypothetical protein ACRECO_10370 [Xanthobacteraceae bacterium]